VDIADYFMRYEHILELEMLGELTEEEKGKLTADLLTDIHRVLEFPIHLRHLESEEEEELRSLYSKIVRSSR